jgi:hypothetical protein
MSAVDRSEAQNTGSRKEKKKQKNFLRCLYFCPVSGIFSGTSDAQGTLPLTTQKHNTKQYEMAESTREKTLP